VSRLTIFEKLELMQSEDLRRWLGGMFIAGVIILAAVFGSYAIFFSNHSFRVDSETWGQFGDFIGGTANPLIALLTLFAFVLTLILQNRQLQLSTSELKLSREELELTRHELERSARAQELSEAALSAQAETAARTADLSTLNFLLTAYRIELASYQGQAFMGSDPRAQRPEVLKERLQILERVSDSLFQQIANRTSGK